MLAIINFKTVSEYTLQTCRQLLVCPLDASNYKCQKMLANIFSKMKTVIVYKMLTTIFSRMLATIPSGTVGEC